MIVMSHCFKRGTFQEPVAMEDGAGRISFIRLFDNDFRRELNSQLCLKNKQEFAK